MDVFKTANTLVMQPISIKFLKIKTIKINYNGQSEQTISFWLVDLVQRVFDQSQREVQQNQWSWVPSHRLNFLLSWDFDYFGRQFL